MLDLWSIGSIANISYQRCGLYVRFDKGIDVNVRKHCILFIRWVRLQYRFPQRVMLYVKKNDRIKNSQTDECVTATFFAPDNLSVEPYARVAAGISSMNEYPAVLCSIAHELTHYFQWIKGFPLDENQASKKAVSITRKYLQIRISE